ncbi:hypothetical protein K523DRAFT_263321 [Schizophyllum commune Tattone D]|nr:hypothetical protein K523DRAFT_263321 [Schizophyllum commune Tattone D]
MPIRALEKPPLSDLVGVPEKFVIFYSSVVDGQLWCPYCRDVEDRVQKTFSAEGAPDLLIVHVGDRPEWKTPDAIYRKEPWSVTGVPTLIKLDSEGKEIARLSGTKILNGLDEIIRD